MPLERSGTPLERSGRDKYHSKYVAPEFELSESVLEHSRLTAAHSAACYVTALHCIACCTVASSLCVLHVELRHCGTISSRLSGQLWRKTPLCLNSSARGLGREWMGCYAPPRRVHCE